MSDHLAWLRAKRAISVFALAGALGASAGVRADEPAAADATAGGAAASAPAASAPAGPTPITYGMEGVEAVGLKPAFDDLRLNFYGWAEAGFTYSHEAPTDRVNQLRTFDYRSNDFLLNQVSENLERTLSDGKDFDIGGKIELIEGSDAKFIHSRGLTDNVSGEFNDNPDHGREVSFDPMVFYVDFRIPIGEGLTVKVGKYVTPIGYEVVDAVGNPFYSHSFLFDFAEPVTHTGVEFDYPINDKLSVYFGVVEGWDDFFDRNEIPAEMAGVTWKATDKLTVIFNAITGPEQKDDASNYRTLADLVVTYQLTDALSIGINGDFGNESGVETPGVSTDSNWDGIAVYLNYVLIPSQLNLNARAEYFRDGSASRVGFTADLTEFTLGLDVHPIKDWQNLRIRPEVRWDHSYGVDNAFDASNAKGGSNDQFTIGADVIVTF